LIAEDNITNQFVSIKILNKLGYCPETADNGYTALQMARAKEYDIIFMDVGMPQIDGLEVTRIIRKEFKSQPVIVAITANALQGDKEICLAAGMDDYLSKPLHFESMVKILEKWAKAIQNKVA
jgi:CheY-like chemotaxis protein